MDQTLETLGRKPIRPSVRNGPLIQDSNRVGHVVRGRNSQAISLTAPQTESGNSSNAAAYLQEARGQLSYVEEHSTLNKIPFLRLGVRVMNWLARYNAWRASGQKPEWSDPSVNPGPDHPDNIAAKVATAQSHLYESQSNPFHLRTAASALAGGGIGYLFLGPWGLLPIAAAVGAAGYFDARSKSRSKKAMNQLEDIITREPDLGNYSNPSQIPGAESYAWAHYLKGKVHMERNEYSLAKQEFDSAIDLNPTMVVAHRDKAYLCDAFASHKPPGHEKRTLVDEAIQHYEGAIAGLSKLTNRDFGDRTEYAKACVRSLLLLYRDMGLMKPSNANSNLMPNNAQGQGMNVQQQPAAPLGFNQNNPGHQHYLGEFNIATQLWNTPEQAIRRYEGLIDALADNPAFYGQPAQQGQAGVAHDPNLSVLASNCHINIAKLREGMNQRIEALAHLIEAKDLHPSADTALVEWGGGQPQQTYTQTLMKYMQDNFCR